MLYIKFCTLVAFLLGVSVTPVISAPDRTKSEAEEPKTTTVVTSDNTELLARLNNIDTKIQEMSIDIAEIKTLKEDIEDVKTLISVIEQQIKQNKASTARSTGGIKSVASAVNSKATDMADDILGTVSNLGGQVASSGIDKVKNAKATMASSVNGLAKVGKNKAKNLAGSATANASKLMRTGKNIAGKAPNSNSVDASQFVASDEDIVENSEMASNIEMPIESDVIVGTDNTSEEAIDANSVDDLLG